MISFVFVLRAFNEGYAGLGCAADWSHGVWRWAYEMGRRQSKGAEAVRRALEEQAG